MTARTASRALFASLAVLVAACSPNTALAAWPHATATSGVSIRSGVVGNIDNNSLSIPDGSGGVIVVATSTSNVFAQRFDAAGNRLWGSNGVAVTTGAAGSRFNPVGVADGAGGVVLVFEDLRNGAGTDLYAQRFNSDGVPQWGATGVAVCVAANYQSNARITLNTAGSVDVVWEDPRVVIATPDIYAQRLSLAGVPQWTANGVVVCNAAGAQTRPVVCATPYNNGIWVAWQDARTDAGDIYAQLINSSGVPTLAANGFVTHNVATDLQALPEIQSDGSTGAELVWIDNRLALSADLYAQRVNVAGGRLWGISGVIVCAATGATSTPSITTDGLGGMLVAWTDTRGGYSDIYMRRVDATGVARWTADGVAVCSMVGNQLEPVVTSDGNSGAYVVWRDERTGAPDLYMQQFTLAGTPVWTADGNRLCTAANDQTDASIASAGSGGFYATWTDTRGLTGNNTNVFVQRVDEWGYLGAEPSIQDVADVANDQGGRVKVSWNASPLDTDPLFRNIADYQVFRSAPSSLVMASRRAGTLRTSPAGLEGNSGELLVTRAGAMEYYWELLSTIPASHFAGYSTLAATAGDSIAGSNPLTAFLVLARTAGGAQWWASTPDSGYSVDDLAPPAPTNLAGQYAGGTSALHWNPGIAADHAGFRLYRGTTAGFATDPAHFVADVVDTAYADAAGSPYFYRLTAVDVHGNESLAALLQPLGVLGAESPTPGLALGSPWPNPARGALTLPFALPAAAHVRIALYGVDGREVRVLVDAPMNAGRHELGWDARDSRGSPVAAGVYFVRLVSGTAALERRVTLMP